MTTPEQDERDNLPPTTTAQEDVVSAGQRRVNILWEVTQGMIAICITGAIIFTTIVGKSSQELTNAFFLIIGFYFSRTNHTAIGGIGAKNRGPYTGR